MPSSSQGSWDVAKRDIVIPPPQGTWGYLAFDLIRIAGEFHRGCTNTIYPERLPPWECEECSEAFVTYIRKLLAETNPDQSSPPPPMGQDDHAKVAENWEKGWML